MMNCWFERQGAAAIDEFFEQRSRIVLAGVDHRTASRIPASWRDGRSGRIKVDIARQGLQIESRSGHDCKNLCGRAAVPGSSSPNLNNQFCAKLALDHHVDGTPVFDHG